MLVEGEASITVQRRHMSRLSHRNLHPVGLILPLHRLGKVGIAHVARLIAGGIGIGNILGNDPLPLTEITHPLIHGMKKTNIIQRHSKIL